ncbi:MAG: glutaredoxin domain-containing protein [Halioglobus sp.]
MQTITLYSKDYCPYGKAAKSLLREKGLSFNEIEVGNNPELLAHMIDISGRHTVPQIFFGEEHIGGYTELADYFSNLPEFAMVGTCA